MLFSGGDASKVSKTDLAQLMFVSGHVAMKLLVHTEALAAQLRRRHHNVHKTADLPAKPAAAKPSKATKGKKAAAQSDSDEAVDSDGASSDEPTKKRAPASKATKAAGPARASRAKKVVTKYTEDSGSDAVSDEEEAEEEVVVKAKTTKRKTAAAAKKPAATKGKKASKGVIESKSDDEDDKAEAAPKETDLQAELGLNAAVEEADNETMQDIAENHIVYRSVLHSMAT